MQQLTAVHASVQSTSRIFLQDFATACLAEMDQANEQPSDQSITGKRAQKIQDMLQLLDKPP